MPQDKLFDFYNAIKQNPSITGLPDNYNDFKSAMADRGVSEKFFNALRSNKAITGLPQTFDAFEDGLGLKKKDGTTPSSTGATRPFGTTSVYPSGETKPTFPSESTPKEYDPVGRIKLYSESIKHAQARLPKLVAGYNAAVASGDEIGAANFKTEINNTSGRISELEKGVEMQKIGRAHV